MEILLVSLKIGNIVDLKYFGSFDYLGQTHLPRYLWARWKDRALKSLFFRFNRGCFLYHFSTLKHIRFLKEPWHPLSSSLNFPTFHRRKENDN